MTRGKLRMRSTLKCNDSTYEALENDKSQHILGLQKHKMPTCYSGDWVVWVLGGLVRLFWEHLCIVEGSRSMLAWRCTVKPVTAQYPRIRRWFWLDISNHDPYIMKSMLDTLQSWLCKMSYLKCILSIKYSCSDYIDLCTGSTCLLRGGCFHIQCD